MAPTAFTLVQSFKMKLTFKDGGVLTVDGEGGCGFCLPHHVLSQAGVGAGVGRAQPLQLQSVVITDLEPETHAYAYAHTQTPAFSMKRQQTS